jgi:uncharacterized protein involved in exopolysaccharide biosynthesis/Mrp family chromosome partitioning ATPase
MNPAYIDAPIPSRVNGSANGTAQPQSVAPMITVHSISAPPPGLNLGDVYYTLFRHKWKILACAALGVAGAMAAYRFNAPPFQSEAKLFVRYIISENKGIRNDSTAKSPDERGETIMKSETEILGSMDLVRQVVDAIGPEKILAKAGGGKDANTAMAVVKSNLGVNVAPATSVIHIVFRHPDAEIVQPVLREVINRYFKLHVETHTANGMIGDFLAQETDQLRSRLAQTEDDLRKATIKAGIISLEDAKKAYSDQLAAIRRELLTAQAELAQRTAVLEEFNRHFSAESSNKTPEAAVPEEVLMKYANASRQVETLQQAERELLTQFTPENARVKEIHALLDAAMETRNALQNQHPKLIQMARATQHGAESASIDPIALATQITAFNAKIKVLNKQLEDVRTEAARVEQMEGTIVELRRKREMDEANYRNYAASLDQARINETLGNGRVSNIIQIQTPSPPFSDHSRTNKVVGFLLGGGLLVGIAWAFLIELYIDRSIKRPVDLERTLRVPIFLSIPALRRKALTAASPLLLEAPSAMRRDTDLSINGANGVNGHHKPASPEVYESHPLQPFHETLRDRLIAYFESIDLTHKPKLVAVTGIGNDAGVTTTAVGLARSLSETGEGNVLLVDMTVGQGLTQQFLKGKPVCGLDELLDARDNAHVDEKLYVVTENNSDRLSRNLPQRFTKLVPKLKASDFDYIIFDMPPVSQISITPRLASFMDMVLMVVESEKTDRDIVQRATSLLAESRAHVGVILNKTKSYVPARLFQDQLTTS